MKKAVEFLKIAAVECNLIKGEEWWHVGWDQSLKDKSSNSQLEWTWSNF